MRLTQTPITPTAPLWHVELHGTGYWLVSEDEDTGRRQDVAGPYETADEAWAALESPRKAGN